MPTNPNKAFAERNSSWHKSFFANDDLPMNDTQRIAILSVIYAKSIPWQSLCVVALGYNKPMTDLNRGEARTCMLKAHVWDNLKKAGGLL
jgi:hypothetical protein